MGQHDLNGRVGTYATSSDAGGSVRAYVPTPLPPIPALYIASLSGLVSEAMYALGRLDGVCSIVPNTSLLLYMYIRKEALLSSQIEGTQSSLSDPSAL
ncbi:Fic/DOC family N-terminal domain-containing protein [Henriciella sp.]|uniref:Fic/DOC family N-terminal domain-containing protein n=1 Tax=Henriciella sp. TaxID=1968823 RepID=UPI0026091E84|nr:Fic/DOC family N-terminal domain-containing protein [Henriciella sp.]